MRSKTLSEEIFENPADLQIFIVSALFRQGFGFSISRGPGGNSNPIINSVLSGKTPEAAIEAVSELLESVRKIMIENLENTPDQADILSTGWIQWIKKELKEKGEARTYRMPRVS
jgi:hypothetical protein